MTTQPTSRAAATGVETTKLADGWYWKLQQQDKWRGPLEYEGDVVISYANVVDEKGAGT
jgi:predicted membrane-bound mannosyltransferase